MNSLTIKQHTQASLPSQNVQTADSSFVESGNLTRTDKDFIVKDYFAVTNTEVSMRKGQKFNRTGISTLVTGAVYSLAATEYLIGITNLSYAPTIGLPRPSLVGAGKCFIIKDEAGGATTTTITIRSVGEETIDGASTSTLTTNYESKSFYSDGANWFVY